MTLTICLNRVQKRTSADFKIAKKSDDFFMKETFIEVR